ncbi:MAG: hypothetical protein ACYTFW_00915 [Planctomycetota bacterium]|jgi:hypothetical protein
MSEFNKQRERAISWVIDTRSKINLPPVSDEKSIQNKVGCAYDLLVKILNCCQDDLYRLERKTV